MNKLLIAVLAFTAGAGAGYFVADRILDAKYEAKYEARYQDDLDSVKRASRKDAVRELGEYAKMTEEYKSAVVLEDTIEQADTYSDEDVEAVEAFMEAMAQEVQEADIMDADEDQTITLQTFEISENDFQQNCLMHDKVTVNYFNKDGVFTDDEGEPDDDIGGLVNLITLMQLFSGGKQQVWIRNEIIGVDYEVLWNDCSSTEWKDLVRDGRNQG